MTNARRGSAVETTKKVIEYAIEDINADIAAEYLLVEKMPEAGVKGTNRKSSALIIEEYAQAMLRGEWKLNHQGLAFNELGDFVDGGHRMRALIRASESKPDITVKFMVAYNLPADSVITMDIGKRRLPSDFLRMQGEINTTTLSGILRLAYCYRNIAFNGVESWTRFRITPAVQQEFLDANPKLRDSVYEGYPLRKVLKPSVTGAFWFLANELRPEVDVDQFLESLRSGENLTKGNPILTLRELMFNDNANNRSRAACEELALTIKAFNRWAEGGQYTNLSFRYDEAYPRLG